MWRMVAGGPAWLLLEAQRQWEQQQNTTDSVEAQEKRVLTEPATTSSVIQPNDQAT